MSGWTDIRLQERFGFNLWQIAGALGAHGTRCRFHVPPESNLMRYAEAGMVAGLHLVQGTGGARPQYRMGHVYDVRNFLGVGIRSYVDARPIASSATIIHIRGGDYLTAMSPHLQPTRDFFRRAEHALGGWGEAAIMTDDPQHAARLLPGLPILDPADDVLAFRLLAGARRLVCSASAWSWWAGYLGTHERVILADFYGSSPQKAPGLLWPGAEYAE